MYKTEKFDVKITKEEVQMINKIVEKLALLSDLQEIQVLNYYWTNFYHRELFGYTHPIPMEKLIWSISRERKSKGL